MSDHEPLRMRLAATDSRAMVLPVPSHAAQGAGSRHGTDRFADFLQFQMEEPTPVARPIVTDGKGAASAPRAGSVHSPAHHDRTGGVKEAERGKPRATRQPDAEPVGTQAEAIPVPASGQVVVPSTTEGGRPAANPETPVHGAAGTPMPPPGPAKEAAAPTEAPDPTLPLPTAAEPPAVASQPPVNTLLRQGFRNLLTQAGAVELRKGYAAGPAVTPSAAPDKSEAVATVTAPAAGEGSAQTSGGDAGTSDQSPRQDADPKLIPAQMAGATNSAGSVTNELPANAAAVAVPLRMDQPDWTEKLAARLATAVFQGQGMMEMQMSPERLGLLHIRLDLSGAEAKVSIETATPQAAALFADARHGLETALAKSGIALVSHEAAVHVRPPTPDVPTSQQAEAFVANSFAAGGQSAGQDGGQARGQMAAATFRPGASDGRRSSPQEAAAPLRPTAELLNLIA